MKVIRCLELANGAPGPRNQFLAKYDPKTGHSTWTLDKAKAMKFAGPAEAFMLWNSVHEREPVRAHDGKPNKPLTAFTIEIEDA
jgi:hypothetical protein